MSGLSTQAQRQVVETTYKLTLRLVCLSPLTKGNFIRIYISTKDKKCSCFIKAVFVNFVVLGKECYSTIGPDCGITLTFFSEM